MSTKNGATSMVGHRFGQLPATGNIDLIEIERIRIKILEAATPTYGEFSPSPVTMAMALTSFDQLKLLEQSPKISVLLVRLAPAPEYMMAICPELCVEEEEEVHGCRLLAIPGDYYTDEINFECLLVITGRVSCLQYHLAKLQNVISNLYVQHENLLHLSFAEQSYAEKPFSFKKQKWHVFLGSSAQLLHVMFNTDIDLIPRTFSICRLLYPWTSQYLSRFKHIIPCNGINMVQNFRVTGDYQLEADDAKRFIIAASILMLCPAYTRRDMLPQQLAKRISALRATYCQPVYTVAEVQEVFNSLDIRNYFRSPILCELAGRWLSVNRDLQYIERATLTELVKINDLRHDKVLTCSFSCALMNQGKLVYNKKNLTTGYMAVNCLDRVERFLPDVGPQWMVEFNHLKKVEDVFYKCPFVGLRISQAIDLRIRNFPRFALLGKKLFEDSWDEARKKTFENYTLTNASSKLTEKDKTEVDTLKDMLPTIKEFVVETFLNGLPFDAADSLAKTLDPAMKEKVLHRLMSRRDGGPWANYHRDRAQNPYVNTLLEGAEAAATESTLSTSNNVE